MNRYQYIAYSNPRGASQVVSHFGMRPHRHPQALSKQLAKAVADHRDEASDMIADIHPDLPFFQSKLDGFKKKYKDEFKNASGCGCNSNFSNANGQTMKSDITDRKSGDKTELLIIGGIILLSLTILNK